MGQRILHPSNSADFNNYFYDTVVAGSGTTYTVTFNGTQYTFPGGTTFELDVKSVEVGSPNVYLSGYLVTFDFPVYLGNSWSTDYLGRPIIQSSASVWAQSGNTQYAFYK